VVLLPLDVAFPASVAGGSWGKKHSSPFLQRRHHEVLLAGGVTATAKPGASHPPQSLEHSPSKPGNTRLCLAAPRICHLRASKRTLTAIGCRGLRIFKISLIDRTSRLLCELD
jgi:hypothetical protein